MIQSDALSRGILTEKEREGRARSIEDIITETHILYNHRKNIFQIIKAMNLNISTNKIKEIISKCKVCNKKDSGINKGGKYIETQKPGEILGIDLLQIGKNERVIVAIDYFTRKIFTKAISTKEGFKIKNFLNHLKEQIEIKSIRTDSGKEFDNKDVESWCKEHGVVHELIAPYYHKGNGRVERVNRTLRNAIRKTPGILKIKLKSITENYNNAYHRAIGMTPNQAQKEENHERLLINIEKYKKEFKRLKEKVFQIDDDVLIRNETKVNKMDDDFKEEGKIIKAEKHGCYEIKLNNGKQIKRHFSQLRKF